MIKRYFQFIWNSAEKAYEYGILSMIKSNRDGKLLDLGCDDGEWTFELDKKMRARDGNVFGIEIIKERYDLAIKKGIRIKKADLNDRFPFDNNIFDVVHASQVIEHVWDIDNFAEEIKRVLKPKGYAIICTENLSSWHNIFALMFGLQPFSLTNISVKGSIGNPLALGMVKGPSFSSWYHTRVLSYSGLKDIFIKHGFKIEEYRVFGYFPFPPPLSNLLSKIDPRHGAFPVIKVVKI